MNPKIGPELNEHQTKCHNRPHTCLEKCSIPKNDVKNVNDSKLGKMKRNTVSPFLSGLDGGSCTVCQNRVRLGC